MPTVALEHATIDYREWGPTDSSHPPVLFVHGMINSGLLWGGVAEQLARQGFRCIAPTWPLGAHTIPVNAGADLSPLGVATMINEFMSALDLSEVTLVGNDLGGGICQFLIDAHPDRIGRVVLTNCDALDEFPPFPFSAALLLMRGPVSIGAMMWPMGFTPLRHSPFGVGPLVSNPDPELTASWFAPCRKDRRIRRDLATLVRHLRATDVTELVARLPRFAKPVTVVWGQVDRAFTPSLGRRLAALFPHSTLIEVPNARTFVSLDNPTAVADAITSTC